MIFAAGPFVGSFEQEIVTFRPYIKWVHEAIHPDVTYMSTHFNRKFLYDFVPDENFVPIYKHLSRDELGQDGYVHKSFILKDFNSLVRTYRDNIAIKEGCNKKDVNIKYLNYTKSVQPYPIHNKIFDSISTDGINIPDEYKNMYVFVPYNGIIETIHSIHKYLGRNYRHIVIGDMRTYLINDNVLLKKPDYPENGWKYLIGIISHAKAVICPISYWTLICNLQNVPVFSWGEGVGPYREGGIYHLNNKDCKVVTGEDVIESLRYFLSEFK